MRDGPHIAKVASLIGDPARAEMLTALMSGMALTATELANHAHITKQTASSHLARLVEAQLLAVAVQGRHRYFRLADDDVAQLLESLMGVAARSGALRLRSSPREPALRKARVCYRHLAGELGVLVYDSLLAGGALVQDGAQLMLTDVGRAQLGVLGVDTHVAASSRRAPCRCCLDWSERRHHLAGPVAERLLERVFELGWARRAEGTRVVVFSAEGERRLKAWCEGGMVDG